jgi:hypothetical protein
MLLQNVCFVICVYEIKEMFCSVLFWLDKFIESIQKRKCEGLISPLSQLRERSTLYEGKPVQKDGVKAKV